MTKKIISTIPAERFRISVEAATQLIVEHMLPANMEPVAIEDANQRILREPVYAERDQPPFDRATMDGIAISSGNIGSNNFSIAGIQAAGKAALTLPDGSCIEVMTGAVMPTGADTVIPVERINIMRDNAAIEADYSIEPAQFVHPQGSDHKKGEVLLQPGIKIGPAEMAVLAAAGKPRVLVSSTPTIAIVSTGDELVDVGEPITAAQIRSSNDRAMESSLRQAGYLRTQRQSFPDDPEALRNGIAELLASNDILVLSGGVSMGKYDYMPQVLTELGVEVVFHKITQRPGLPMWFGISKDRKPIFALPGNPVSALVCLTRYVLPAIRQSQLQTAQETGEKVVLSEALSFPANLSWFVPVTLRYQETGMAEATPKLPNTSGDFISLSGSAGFIELPKELAEFPAGYVAQLFRW